MKKIGFIFLRLGLGLTFIGIGYMILQNPAGWAGFIKPWVANFLPVSAEKFMFSNAIFDIILGSWLILGWKQYISGFLASIHLFLIIIAIGFNPASVRDIGLLGTALFLTMYNWPDNKSGRGTHSCSVCQK